MHALRSLLYSVLAAWLSGQHVGHWLVDFPWSMPDLWLTCDHFVGKVSAVHGSTNQANSALHPSRVGKLVIHVITWITGWRSLNGRPEGVWLFGCRSKSVAAGLAYSIQAIRPLRLWHKKRRCSCSCGLWRYISVICLWLIMYTVMIWIKTTCNTGVWAKKTRKASKSSNCTHQNTNKPVTLHWLRLISCIYILHLHAVFFFVMRVGPTTLCFMFHIFMSHVALNVHSIGKCTIVLC